MDQQDWIDRINHSRKQLTGVLKEKNEAQREVYVENLLKTLALSEGMALVDLFILQDLTGYQEDIRSAPVEALPQLQASIQTLAKFRERLFEWGPLLRETHRMIEESKDKAEYNPGIPETWKQPETTK